MLIGVTFAGLFCFYVVKPLIPILPYCQFCVFVKNSNGIVCQSLSFEIVHKLMVNINHRGHEIAPSSQTLSCVQASN